MQILQPMSPGQTCPSAGLRAQNNNGQGAFRGSSSIPELCYSWPSSKSDSTILRKSCLKHPSATHSFGPQPGLSCPARIITLRAAAFNGSSGSSANHFHVLGQSVSVSQWFPSRWGNGVDTMGKNVKKYGDPNSGCFSSWS